MGVPDALRARIRELEGGVAIVRRRVPTGVPAVDALVGGLPRPGILELTGPEGSGRVRVAALVAAALARRGEPVAWIDPARRLHPPGLAALGVPLDRLLLVRPPEDGSAPWAWATEQVARSGSFGLVVLDQPRFQGVRRAFSQGFARAVEQGGTTLVVISGRSTRELPADVRLATGDGALVVVRDRGRDALAFARGSAPLPEAPPGARPFADPLPPLPRLPPLAERLAAEAPRPGEAPWWASTTAGLPMPALPARARLARGQRRRPPE